MADPFEDVVVTPAAREYLAAFTRWKLEERHGLSIERAAALSRWLSE